MDKVFVFDSNVSSLIPARPTIISGLPQITMSQEAMDNAAQIHAARAPSGSTQLPYTLADAIKHNKLDYS